MLSDFAEAVVLLSEENARLRVRVKELEAQLGKNSHNSSKPPSTDNPYTKAKARSQRKPTGRKPGGQPGHKGSTLERTDQPDRYEYHHPTGHCACGEPLEALELSELSERRQSVEVQIQKRVIEHVVTEGTCRCGLHHQGQFPTWLKGAIQYGPSVQGLATYMTEYQLLPFARTAEFFQDIANIPLSPATVVKANQNATNELEPIVATIRKALIQSPVAHADESGMRVNDKLHWLHVLSNEFLTSYWIHPKRGREALDDFGLLSLFEGVLVHDHWSAYSVYSCLHAMCNSHHMRELIAIKETPNQFGRKNS
jgi:transposase